MPTGTKKPVLQGRSRVSPAPRSPQDGERTPRRSPVIPRCHRFPLTSSQGTVTGLRESSKTPSKNHDLEAGSQRHHKLYDFYDEVCFQNSPNRQSPGWTPAGPATSSVPPAEGSFLPTSPGLQPAGLPVSLPGVWG